MIQPLPQTPSLTTPLLDAFSPSDLLSSFQSDAFKFEGYLFKKGAPGATPLSSLLSSRYKKRWLRLDVVRGNKQQKLFGASATLLYFECHNSVKTKGQIDINTISSVDTKSNDGPTDFPLNITTSVRTYSLCCASSTEQTLWRSALEKLLNTLSMEAVLEVVHRAPPLPPLSISPATLTSLSMAEDLHKIRVKANQLALTALPANLFTSESDSSESDSSEFSSFGATSSTPDRGPVPLLQPTALGGAQVMTVDGLLADAKKAEPLFAK
ncbi:hypothetical protein TeGR_g12883, partial [Tetraparma gracilis]